MKKSWEISPAAPAEFFAATEIPPIAAQILFNRGLTNHSDISRFLNPSSPISHDPFLLPGMQNAVERITDAINSKEIIGIFGDFDADGVTATTLITEGITHLNGKVAPYIPHRIDEGHGLNREAVQALKDIGASLIVTVDCGVTSFDEVAFASDLGMDVIITDHHLPPSNLPKALAIIDPKVPNSSYPFDDLAGVGLALKLIQGLYRSLGVEIPQGLSELAALGTVADLAPLIDENRSLVKEGIAQLKNTQRPGMQALCQSARLEPNDINSEAISFTIAPRLNASGRIQHAISSYHLLTSQSTQDAERLANEIESFNRDRQQQTKEAVSLAKTLLPQDKDLPYILLIDSPEFAPGSSGLVASRLVDEFYRPTIIMALSEGLVRASGRSISQFHLVDGLHKCEDLFMRFGGHSMAAGFVMDERNLQEFKDRMHDIASESLSSLTLNPKLSIDVEVAPNLLMGDTYKTLAMMEPFGMDNPIPKFLARNINVMSSRFVGSNGQHIKMKLEDDGTVWDAIAFNQAETLIPVPEKIDLVYTLSKNNWRGQNLVTLKILDFRSSE